MFQGKNTFEKPEPGTHIMKVVDFTLPDENLKWSLTFGKGGFRTTAFGKSPFLKEEGTAQDWSKVVGGNGGWTVSTLIFFQKIMGREKTDEVVSRVSKEIVSNYPTFEEQFESLERVRGSVRTLLTELLKAAEPSFKTVLFEVDLKEYPGIDKEGNETTYVQLEKPSLENEYKIPYRVIMEEKKEPQEAWSASASVNEDVPDWVNNSIPREEPETTEDW